MRAIALRIPCHAFLGEFSVTETYWSVTHGS